MKDANHTILAIVAPLLSQIVNVRPCKMKSRSSKFCPKCGEYWYPLADYVPKPFHAPLCLRCNVSVEPTGFSLLLVAFFAPLVFGLAFSMCLYGDPGPFFIMGVYLLWFLPIIQWTRQIRARRRFKKLQDEQIDSPNP
jgi:hypothetical protein